METSVESRRKERLGMERIQKELDEMKKGRMKTYPENVELIMDKLMGHTKLANFKEDIMIEA